MISLLENLRSHTPFDMLTLPELKMLEENAVISYYPDNTTLWGVGERPRALFYIIKGSVEATEDDTLIDIYHHDDTFGGIELIEDQPSAYRYHVTQELICYEITPDIFLRLCNANKDFKSYFFSTIIERMDMLKTGKMHGDIADMMVARVDSAMLSPAVVVEADRPIIEALSLLEEEQGAALIVRNDEGYGIVTDADFRRYILRREREELTQVSQIQSYPIISIDDDDLMFNVLLLMTEHSIKHLPVFDSGRSLLGILELVDLLSLFSNQSHLITVQMDSAKTLDEVVAAASRVSLMVGALHTKGVKSRYIAKMVAQMKRKMYGRLYELIIPREWHPYTALLLLGSEGREEQILRTDQDNALIFADGFEPEGQEEAAQLFISTLERIGFPLCKGGVMITNPRWRKSLGAYKEDIRQTIDAPSQESLMDTAILFDSVAIAGEAALHEELVSYIISRFADHKEFISYFAKPIENFESPLGLFSGFVTSSKKEHKNEIDIKKGAIFALTHGIRSLALEYGIRTTNTTLRIKELNNIGYMGKDEAAELLEALEVVSRLRLDAQLEKLQRGETLDNYISLDKLGKLEKDLLKEALKTIDRFKKRISYHFKLSAVG